MKIQLNREKKQVLIINLVLFVISLIIGILSLSSGPQIITGDEITIYLNAKVILIRHGLPYYKWWHTPLYQYLVAVVILIFNNNLLLLKIIHILLYALSVILLYWTVKLKWNQIVALVSSFFYMTSYVVLYSTHMIHQEAMLGIFLIATYFCFFQYEKNRKSLWLLVGMFLFGIVFFIKETALVVVGIYLVYIIFWIKPTLKELIFSAGILLIFLIPFLIVQYLQDWNILRTYLGVGMEGSDTFLSRNNGLELEKYAQFISFEFIPFLFSGFYFIIRLLQFIKAKKITSDEVLIFSYIVYLLFNLVTRSTLLHFSYISWILAWMAGMGIEYIIHKMKNRIHRSPTPQESVNREALSSKKVKRTLQISTSLIIFILCLQMVNFGPSIFYIKNLYKDRIDTYSKISNIVQNNRTYSESPDAIGYYINDYYSPESWFSSYQRHAYLFWNTSEVFVLTSMKNITDYGIKYFIFDDNGRNSQFFCDIISNGTLTLVERYEFPFKMTWYLPAKHQTVELYVYNP